MPFQSLMTPITEEEVPIAGGVGEGGIADGLYSVHLRMLDGLDGGLTGVMLLNRGRILGGDAAFYYLGSYTAANGRWKGEIVNHEHTPSRSERPLFGGYEVGIGFSGTYGDLLDYVIFAALLFYALTVLGLFVLRFRRPDADRPYRALGYPILPLLYVVLCTAVMVDLLIVSIWASAIFA